MLDHLRFIIGSIFLFLQRVITSYPNIDNKVYKDSKEFKESSTQSTKIVSDSIRTRSSAKISEEEITKAIDKTIMSYNIHHGFNYKYDFKLNDMIKFIIKQKCGIICLQEINNEEQFNYIYKLSGYEHGYYSNNMCILSDFRINKSNVVRYSDLNLYRSNYFIHSNIDINGTNIDILNIHFTNDITGFKQMNEKQEITNYIESNNLEDILLIGDTNCIDLFDKTDILKKILKKNKLVATYPAFYPIFNFDKLYTRNINILNRTTHNLKDSDHLAISYVFNLGGNSD